MKDYKEIIEPIEIRNYSNQSKGESTLKKSYVM